MQVFRQRGCDMIERSKPVALIGESRRKLFSGYWIDCTKIARAAARSYHGLSNIVCWTGPVMALIVLPKCPMCLVGYIALVTGAGISMAVAEALHTVVTVGAVALLAWLVFRAVRRRSHRTHSNP